ncbi:MAG: outer membrane beta-barrel protein [Sideroxydans sp.]|nr:outer membrane beta-barrel protein [Sideroxydans sp.]MDD5056641.1 outer membrane beta-barrel protein [Sideroxydans sp.]
MLYIRATVLLWRYKAAFYLLSEGVAMRKYLLLLVLCFPIAVHAVCNCADDDEEGDDSRTLHSDHFYIGVGGGRSTSGTPATLIDAGVRQGDVAYEVNYLQLGERPNINNINHYGLSIVGYLFQSRDGQADFNVFGRLGYGASTTLFTDGTTTSAKGFYFGAGIEYGFTPNFSMRGEINKITYSDTSTAITKGDVSGAIKFVYHFH